VFTARYDLVPQIRHNFVIKGLMTEDCYTLGRAVVWSGRNALTFRSNIPL